MTDREKLIKIVADATKGVARYRVSQIVDKLIAADVVGVRHGEWKPAGTFDDFAKCSVCGLIDHSLNEVYSRGTYNYCPNCGAKMDGERREE